MLLFLGQILHNQETTRFFINTMVVTVPTLLTIDCDAEQNSH